MEIKWLKQYPAMEEVEKASHEQLCRYHRFLPSPSNEDEIRILDMVEKRLHGFGGFTPEISKKIGWEPYPKEEKGENSD